MIEKENTEQGTVIMEAVMIFPLVILTVVMLLTVGNAYYQQSRVEAIIQTEVINGTAYCTDSLLRYMLDNGSVPESIKDAPDNTPYQYLFSGETKNLVEGVRTEINRKIEKLDSGYFRGMEVRNLNLTLDYSNYFVAQTVKANATYEINIPISLFGTRFKVNSSSHVEVPVSDCPEFIRNVDMIIDYVERTKLDDKFKEMIEKVKTFID